MRASILFAAPLLAVAYAQSNETETETETASASVCLATAHDTTTPSNDTLSNSPPQQHRSLTVLHRSSRRPTREA